MADVDSQVSAQAISHFLLALYGRAQELPYSEFRRFAMERLSELISHEAGLLGSGTIQGGVPRGHDVFLFNRPPALMESWAQVNHEDAVAVAAMANPGRTVCFDVEGPVFADHPKVREHCRTWRIAHVLCTAIIDPVSGLYSVLSNYREDAARPFSETCRATIELVAPHVVSAVRKARLHQLQVATSVPAPLHHAGCVVSIEGMVLEAEPMFIELLRHEVKDFAGPVLPEWLFRALRESCAAPCVLERIVLTSHAVEGVYLAQARRKIAADSLTAREREVARAFSLGDTYRTIGERLGIAPNTVRRHLANIYEKLGISSKAELDRMVSDV